MSQSWKSELLRDQVALLVKHFGPQRVRAALAGVSPQESEDNQRSVGKPVPQPQTPARVTVTSAIKSIRETDPEKHRILTEFLARLVERQVLPESQDIRHFSQLVGLKEINGKSRKEMVPQLMRFLLEQPVERLQSDVQRADGISEQQRRMGFSVLTDKLLDK